MKVSRGIHCHLKERYTTEYYAMRQTEVSVRVVNSGEVRDEHREVLNFRVSVNSVHIQVNKCYVIETN